MSRVIGFIPARGGSKGVKRKNVRSLSGKPLIAYAIESALESRLITELYITTDDKEVVEIANNYGVQVIDRPNDLSDDHACMSDVIEHALVSLSVNYETNDIFCLLQPTCPFRKTEDIDKSINKLLSSNADAVIGVNEALHIHPERFYSVKGETLHTLMPEYSGVNRQDLPKFYIRNGIIYTLRVSNFLKNKKFSPENSIPIVIPLERTTNIDEESDFLYAEFQMERTGVLRC